MSSYGDNTYGEKHVTQAKETTTLDVKAGSVTVFAAKANKDDAAASTVGFFGVATPATQHVAIPDPTSGNDAETQAAIVAILVALRSYGLVAPNASGA